MTRDPAPGALVALNASGGEPGQWVQLLAAGKNQGRDGRGPFEVKDPAAVIRNSFAAVAGGVLPIDINHAIDVSAPKGEASPAVGWITRMEWRGAGGLWGYAAWTPPGATALQNKEYRFLSPALAHDGKGGVLAVLRASLVNNPNLNLVALNAAAGGHGQDAMAGNLLAELRTLLALPDTADETQALATLKERLTSRNAVDPAKYVPIELFQQTVKELNNRNTGMSQDDAEAVVKVALQENMLMPYMKDWAVSLCMRDRASYDDFIAGAAGQQINGFIRGLSGSHKGAALMARERERIRAGSGGDGTAAADDDINKTLGLSADDVTKFGGKA